MAKAKNPAPNSQLLTPAAQPLVVVVGPTASGKSDLALLLGERLGGEIICADSWTVRKEVNIGTSKPDAEERERVPHHLLDIAEPCADFTAAVFKRLAVKKIDDISDRGVLPIMAGGTGLYIDGVIFDYNFLPGGDRTARQELSRMTPQGLVDLAQSRGLSVDSIDTRNKRRIIRLIETKGAVPSRGTLRPNTLIIGLRMDRVKLRERVECRTDVMIASGLEAEVKMLSNRYGWDCEALKGIGYIEWRAYFLGAQTLAQTRDKIITHTMQLAKRQMTWFKRNESIQWVVDPRQAVDIATTFLSKKQW